MAEPNGSGDPGNPGGGGGESWVSQLDEETRGYVQNKGWAGEDPVESFGKAIGSYRNLEKMVGAPEDQIVRLPGAEANPSAWDDVYNKLGRPQDPKDYDIQVPEGADASFADWARGNFHKLGLTKIQAKGLTEGWNAYVAEQVQGIQQQSQLNAEEAQTALKKEWGAKYEANVSLVDRTAAQLGMTKDHLAAFRDTLGPAEAMKFIAGLGAKLGEDQFISGGGGGGFDSAMTPAQAEARIAQLKADETFRKRYLAGEPTAQDEMSRLHRWAYGKSQ